MVDAGKQRDRGQRTARCDGTIDSTIPTLVYSVPTQSARAITAGANGGRRSPSWTGRGFMKRVPHCSSVYFSSAVSLALPHSLDQIFHPMIDSLLLLLRVYGNLFTHSSQQRLLS